MNNPICPVCGSQDSGVLFYCTDFFKSKELFPILICNRCSLRMTGSAPDETGIGMYYQSDDYISHSDTSKGFVNFMYHRVRSFMLDRKKNLVERSAGIKHGSLLDIGAGTGYFLHYMRERGWKVKGTEKSAAAREFAGRQWNMELLPGEGLDSLPVNYFDAVTLWHVMEHLYNPGHYWERLVKLLKKDGCLLIALPNPESWDCRHYREYWAAWDVPRHLWHFSPDNIVRLAGKYGFQLQKTVRMPFDAFYVSILSEKYRKTAFPVLRGLFFGTVSWLSALFNIRRSSSLIYIFKPGN